MSKKERLFGLLEYDHDHRGLRDYLACHDVDASVMEQTISLLGEQERVGHSEVESVFEALQRLPQEKWLLYCRLTKQLLPKNSHRSYVLHALAKLSKSDEALEAYVSNIQPIANLSESGLTTYEIVEVCAHYTSEQIQALEIFLRAFFSMDHRSPGRYINDQQYQYWCEQALKCLLKIELQKLSPTLIELAKVFFDLYEGGLVARAKFIVLLAQLPDFFLNDLEGVYGKVIKELDELREFFVCLSLFSRSDLQKMVTVLLEFFPKLFCYRAINFLKFMQVVQGIGFERIDEVLRIIKEFFSLESEIKGVLPACVGIHTEFLSGVILLAKQVPVSSVDSTAKIISALGPVQHDARSVMTEILDVDLNAMRSDREWMQRVGVVVRWHQQCMRDSLESYTLSKPVKILMLLSAGDGVGDLRHAYETARALSKVVGTQAIDVLVCKGGGLYQPAWEDLISHLQEYVASIDESSRYDLASLELYFQLAIREHEAKRGVKYDAILGVSFACLSQLHGSHGPQPYFMMREAGGTLGEARADYARFGMTDDCYVWKNLYALLHADMVPPLSQETQQAVVGREFTLSDSSINLAYIKGNHAKRYWMLARLYSIGERTRGDQSPKQVCFITGKLGTLSGDREPYEPIITAARQLGYEAVDLFQGGGTKRIALSGHSGRVVRIVHRYTPEDDMPGLMWHARDGMWGGAGDSSIVNILLAKFPGVLEVKRMQLTHAHSIIRAAYKLGFKELVDWFDYQLGADKWWWTLNENGAKRAGEYLKAHQAIITVQWQKLREHIFQRESMEDAITSLAQFVLKRREVVERVRLEEPPEYSAAGLFSGCPEVTRVSRLIVNY